MSVFGIPYNAPIKAQQKHRQDQLILAHIPAQEYSRLANGKLSCSVCAAVGRTPVLDTAQTLQIHRNSKKHAEAVDAIALLKAQKAEREARDHQRLRQQQEAESTAARLAAHSIALQTALEAPQQPHIGVALPTSSLAPQTHQAVKFTQRKRKDRPEMQDTLSTSTTAPPEALQPLYKRTKTGEYVQVTSFQTASDVERGAVDTAVRETQRFRDPLDRHSLNEVQWSGFQLEAARSQYFASLRERGWRQNQHGQWYRDPNVEFDDDDELPPAAPPGLDIVLELVDPHDRIPSSTLS